MSVKLTTLQTEIVDALAAEGHYIHAFITSFPGHKFIYLCDSTGKHVRPINVSTFESLVSKRTIRQVKRLGAFESLWRVAAPPQQHDDDDAAASSSSEEG